MRYIISVKEHLQSWEKATLKKSSLNLLQEMESDGDDLIFSGSLFYDKGPATTKGGNLEKYHDILQSLADQFAPVGKVTIQRQRLTLVGL